MACLSLNLEKSTNSSSQPSLDLVLPRRIVFHPARKPSDSFQTGDFKLETLNPGLNSQKISQNPIFPALTKASDAAEAQEIVLDPELTLGIGFKRIGAGLANLGNTCYLNSVLQCLTYTEPLAAYLQSGKHKSSCHIAGFCAMCAIQNHVRSALQSSGKILSPMHLVRNLRSISHSFRASRQEDAHEYMVNLMESMHRCCLPSGVSSESPSAYEKSLVHKIFGGKLRSQVKCTQCSHCSNTFDPFLDLSLQIVKADSLPKALAHFTAVEELDGGQKQYQCARCKEKVRARKQLTIHKAPYVLTIHLKRFGSGEPGHKIDKKVEFGSTLNLKPYVSGPYEGDLKYSLYGVLVHAGWSTHSGHYYCFVRTSSGIWHALDDNRVSQVSEKSVMTQKAYMLFYVFDRKSSNMKKPSIIQNGIIPGSVNKAVENGWNHSVEKRNGNSVSAASMIKEVTLRKMDYSKVVTNSFVNSKHTGSKSSNLKTDVGTALGCLQQSAESIKASSNASINSAGSAKATVGDAKTVIVNEHTSNNRNMKLVPEEKLVIPSGSGSRVISSCTIHDNNPDISKSGTTDKDYVQRSAILSTEDTNSHIPSHKKLLAANGSIGCQPAGSGGEEKTGDPIRSMKDSVAQLSIDVQAIVTNDRSKEALTKENTSYHALDLKRTVPKGIKKRKYPPMLPISRGRMFLAALKVQKDYKQKARSQVRKSIAKGILNTKPRSQNGVPEQVPGDPVHAQSMPCQVDAAYRENGYANLRDHGQCDNGNRRTGMIRDRKMQRTPEKNEAGDLACVRGANGQPTGAVQNKFRDLLSKGLSPIAVARWDDGEASESQQGKQFQAKPLTSVGYVLDEWDEEYDQGKRKKIKKSKHLDGMGNPFQEIATKKAKLKHTNLEQTRLGHQPLRI